MAYDAWRLDEARLVLFWSRKAGNTSLAEWLAEARALRPRPGESGRARKLLNDFRIDTGQALDLIDRQGWDNCVLARHPLVRMTSAYLDKFCYLTSDSSRNAQQDGRSLDMLRPFAQRLVTDVMQQQGQPVGTGDAYTGISFLQFARHVHARVAHARAAGNEPRLNAHFLPQVPLALVRSGFRYGQVLRLERVQEDIGPLARRLGIAAPFPHARRADASAPPPPADEDLSGVPSAELVRAGIHPRSGNLLVGEALALLREAVAGDFPVLGYSPDALR